MDRFIDYNPIENYAMTENLKSNMDRFIDFAFTNPRTKMINLKSNMDRFIEKKRGIKL